MSLNDTILHNLGIFSILHGGRTPPPGGLAANYCDDTEIVYNGCHLYQEILVSS